MEHPIQSYLDALHARLAPMTDGRLADYIPELTKVDANGLGVCLVTMDGVAYSVGDAERPFTIQSISKPFVFGAALADRGQPFGDASWTESTARVLEIESTLRARGRPRQNA